MNVSTPAESGVGALTITPLPHFICVCLPITDFADSHHQSQQFAESIVVVSKLLLKNSPVTESERAEYNKP